MEGTNPKEENRNRYAKVSCRTSRSETKLGLGRSGTKPIGDTGTKSMCGYGEPTICGSMVPTIGVASARNGLDGKIARGV